MGVTGAGVPVGSTVPAGPVRSARSTWHRAMRVARVAALGTGGAALTAAVTTGVLLGQARQARRTIPMAEAPPPRCDGLYGPKFPGKPLTLVVLGDSSAAGYGVFRPRETLAALLATGLSRRLRRPVKLRRFAVVGCLSSGLPHQVEAALEVAPDIAVILIGGNDVTNRTPPWAAVRYLADAVRDLRAAGAEVVVGTCPDLGAIQPIKPPLRWVARRWGRQLAAAQTVAVVEAGGWTVSLGDLLGPRFTAEPARMFAWDRFHPSAEGYAVAAAALLPTVLSALGSAPERRGALGRHEGVRSLPEAAQEAARHAGTEVSGTRVSGRERGPAGRWAQLRRRRALFGAGSAPQPPEPTAPPDTPAPQPPDTATGAPTVEGRA
ncbi:SGNH/GDSL hydrolase family protein [Micromonospora echinofusca]|uniref:SGNH/GDSL hydrolase family protein n=1 Tax=Micromonospora echinofusca TaxID=47858 RepID=A0ABS3VWG6_MICEH|nr:SGNH/GDSL hydrolase family protein [Micromonospora echinofusca]MBO4208845.1 SGNH/GDSL hydrolase family protein [Micromonospora echinofusca]